MQEGGGDRAGGGGDGVATERWWAGGATGRQRCLSGGEEWRGERERVMVGAWPVKLILKFVVRLALSSNSKRQRGGPLGFNSQWAKPPLCRMLADGKASLLYAS